MENYIVVSVILLVSLLVYFKIAKKYNIVDKPNHRSAHTEITLRGGGIIFWIAAALISGGYYPEFNMFFIGITILSLVSFWDDLKSLKSTTRLLFQTIAVGLLIYHFHTVFNFYVLCTLLGFVLCLAILNAYNFMDGINGMTGLYSLLFFVSAMYINESVDTFIPIDFLVYPALACLVFLVFNFRKKAKCFAGDIGSISIAFWILYVLINLIFITNSYIWLLLLAVYAAETGLTIAHRIYLRENITLAHRHHFYQILVNDLKWPHLFVSTLYSILQLLVSLFVLYAYQNNLEVVCYVFTSLVLISIYSIKFYILKKIKSKS